MGEQVLGLEVVLPTGDIIRTRAVPKTSAGPALHHLFIGAEGVFGVITQATLRVFREPEAREFRCFDFPTFEDGYNAMLEMFSIGLRPALVDLTEEPDDSRDGASGSPPPFKTWLYMVFEGYAEEVEAQCCPRRPHMQRLPRQRHRPGACAGVLGQASRFGVPLQGALPGRARAGAPRESGLAPHQRLPARRHSRLVRAGVPPPLPGDRRPRRPADSRVRAVDAA